QVTKQSVQVLTNLATDKKDLLNNVFVFTRRRRHTRSKRDWSSDVCSSDLAALTMVCSVSAASSSARHSCSAPESTAVAPVGIPRSEERRVGKECGSRRVAKRSGERTVREVGEDVLM